MPDGGEGSALLAGAASAGAAQPSYAAEAHALFKLAWPVVCRPRPPAARSLTPPQIVTYLLEMSPGLVNVMFVGHLGEEENLDALALGTMFQNVFGFAVGFGFATALDTLCTQAHGAGRPALLGVYLQRGVVVLSVLFVGIAALNWHAAGLLEAAGQPRDVAELAGRFCRVGLVGMPPLLLYELLKKVLQAQSLVMPLLYIAALGNAVNLAACYYFVDRAGMGYLGAAWARNLGNGVMVLVLLVYMRFWTQYRYWWRGLSRAAFQGLGEFLGLAIPGAALLVCEWVAFEVLALFAGWLPDAEVAIGANAVLLNISIMTFMFSLGVSVSSSVRIGNYLGAGRPDLARMVSRLSLAVGLGVGSAMGVSLHLARRYAGRIFATDAAVLAAVETAVPALASYQVFDAVNVIASGVLRGMGKPQWGAGLNAIAYYVIGLPCSYAFALKLREGLPGLWYGMNAALLFYSSVASGVILMSDWRVRAAEAVSRSGGAGVGASV